MHSQLSSKVTNKFALSSGRVRHRAARAASDAPPPFPAPPRTRRKGLTPPSPYRSISATYHCLPLSSAALLRGPAAHHKSSKHIHIYTYMTPAGRPSPLRRCSRPLSPTLSSGATRWSRKQVLGRAQPPSRPPASPASTTPATPATPAPAALSPRPSPSPRRPLRALRPARRQEDEEEAAGGAAALPPACSRSVCARRGRARRASEPPRRRRRARGWSQLVAWWLVRTAMYSSMYLVYSYRSCVYLSDLTSSRRARSATRDVPLPPSSRAESSASFGCRLPTSFAFAVREPSGFFGNVR